MNSTALSLTPQRRAKRAALLNYFSLFSSFGTLLCCALPSVLVLPGNVSDRRFPAIGCAVAVARPRNLELTDLPRPVEMGPISGTPIFKESLPVPGQATRSPSCGRSKGPCRLRSSLLHKRGHSSRSIEFAGDRAVHSSTFRRETTEVLPASST